MPALRSRTVTHGSNMAGARALMRATGVAARTSASRSSRSPTASPQFVPGHVHLREVGRVVAEAVTRGGRRPARVQHDRRRRRHRHGPRRHALLPAQPRADRRRGRVHGQRALRRRAGLHLQLRQDHPGHAAWPPCGSTSPPSSSPAARWRPARPTWSTARRPQARPDRRRCSPPADDEVSDEDARRDGGERLPDLRLLLGHVHRQLDELPHRGDRPGAARQRHHAGHPHRPQGALRGRRPRRRRHHPPLLRAGRRVGAAADIATRDGVRERHGPGRRHGRLHQHDPAPAGRRPGGGRRLRPRRHRRAVAPRAVPGKVAPNGDEYHMEDVHRAGGIPAILGELDRAGLLHQRRAHGPLRRPSTSGSRLGLARRHPRPPRRSSCGTRRPAACAPPRPFSQSERWETLDLDRGRRAASAPSSTRTPRTAASPCSTATSPRTARGQDRRASTSRSGPSRARPCVRVARRKPSTASSARQVKRGRRRGHPLRGPQGRPGHAGDALPDELPQGPRPGQGCALITDGRFSGGTSGLSIGHASPEAAAGRRHRPGRGRRHDHDRHPRPVDHFGSAGGRTRRPPGAAPQGTRWIPAAEPAAPGAAALRAYAAMATSASTGAARDVSQVERTHLHS